MILRQYMHDPSLLLVRKYKYDSEELSIGMILKMYRNDPKEV